MKPKLRSTGEGGRMVVKFFLLIQTWVVSPGGIQDLVFILIQGRSTSRFYNTLESQVKSSDSFRLLYHYVNWFWEEKEKDDAKKPHCFNIQKQ